MHILLVQFNTFFPQSSITKRKRQTSELLLMKYLDGHILDNKEKCLEN